MAIRVAVLVPGIMGSRLFYGSGPNRHEIWGENFATNYWEIIKNPELLDWNYQPAQSEPLRYVYVYNRAPFRWWPKYRLWERLLNYLREHEEFGKTNRFGKTDQIWEYSYDWRQSLLDTAVTFGRDVREYSECLAEERGVSPNEICYVFLTHSMGGLLVRIALAIGALNTSVIDQIVHIGSPLDGSASAFRSAYHDGALPMMQALYRVFKRKRNAEVFFQSFLKTVRSFPSVYQLMPPMTNTFLMYTPDWKSHPLKEEIIEEKMRECAREAHNKLDQANKILSRKRRIRVYTIYSEYYMKPTDLEYEVHQMGDPEPGYLIKDPMPYAKTTKGDGTVSMWSAWGTEPPCQRLRVTNVEHASMCNNEKVLKRLMPVL